jgi:ubiquinone/menaquinone biosynthesis C-methylase UbiE
MLIRAATFSLWRHSSTCAIDCSGATASISVINASGRQLSVGEKKQEVVALVQDEHPLLSKRGPPSSRVGMEIYVGGGLGQICEELNRIYGAPVTAQSNVFEVGVGVGAFSKTVSELTGCTHFAGIDPVEEAVVMARQVLPQGHFLVGNGLDLSAFDDNTFDHVLAASVIMYLDDLEEAQQFVREMIRIAKPGGSLMVNCVSEPGGQNPGSGNIFIPKEWWSVAASGAVVTSFQDMSEWTVGQKDRYAVYLTKNASRA